MNTIEIQDGSLRVLWKVSSALMISFISMFAMMFADRFYLSYYSAEALSAATSAGTLFWAGNFMCVTIAAMAEVFIAQYNGSKQYGRLGEPVWQMVWFTGFSFIFFFSLASFGSHFFEKIGFMNAHEVEFYRWSNYFAPFFTLLTALSAFYIGQGKTSIIKWLGLIGNGVNIILDPLFIFGYKGIVPSMGIKGAAIATGIGAIVQVIILAFMFLSKKNKENFGTGLWRFNKSLFLKCLKVGGPPAIFVLLELIGTAAFYMMMKNLSVKHILVASIYQSILILLLFFGMGLEKGAAAVAGNLIGSKNFGEIKRVFISGLKLIAIFSLTLALFFTFYPNFFIDLFFKNPEALHGSTIVISPEMLIEVKTALKFAMITLVIYLTFENTRWLLCGLLTSAGDTLFLMISGVISIWLFMLVPTYFFVVVPKASIERALYIMVFYSLMSTTLLFFRFAKGKWKEKNLILESEVNTTPECY